MPDDTVLVMLGLELVGDKPIPDGDVVRMEVVAHIDHVRVIATFVPLDSLPLTRHSVSRRLTRW